MSYSQGYSRRQPNSRQSTGRRSSLSGVKLRLLIAGAIVLFSVVSYMNKGQVNPVTGEKQRVDMTIQDEIALGLSSVSQMGPQSLNKSAQDHVDAVGFKLVDRLFRALRQNQIDLPYDFEFHLLADSRTVNAFALPGGQVFITEALYRRLDSDDALAGVLGHEIGHVIERHGAQRMAKGNLWKGIAGAAGVAGGDVSSSRAAAMVGNMVNMKYGRDDELESDEWGVELMVLAGYNPRHLLDVMDVLEASSGGGSTPEFMSTHPRPANRRAYIEEIIRRKYPELATSDL